MNEGFASEDAPVAWMRTRLTDPKAVAERQVKSEADKIREELKAEREAREKRAARESRSGSRRSSVGVTSACTAGPPRPRASSESLAALQVRAVHVW